MLTWGNSECYLLFGFNYVIGGDAKIFQDSWLLAFWAQGGEEVSLFQTQTLTALSAYLISASGP